MPSDPPVLPPSQLPLPGSPPSLEKSPETEASAPDASKSSARAAFGSRASLTDDELTTRKKDLVNAFDALVVPLDEILKTMKLTHSDIQRAYRGGLLFLVFSGLMGLVQVHTTLRMAEVQQQLAAVMEAQKQLQTTTTQVAAKQTEADQQSSKLAQITLEPSLTPNGDPTAIVVVKPPSGADASAAAPVPLGVLVPAPVQAVSALPLGPLDPLGPLGSGPGSAPRKTYAPRSAAAAPLSAAPLILLPSASAAAAPAAAPKIQFE
jgi:hypothetical protein